MRLFVTGTDTGVGKTEISKALAIDAVRQSGTDVGYQVRVFAYKPIETGIDGSEASIRASDACVLAAAAGDWQRGEEICAYRLPLAAAPSVAAAAAGIHIDLERVLAIVNRHREATLVVVEGAGGWRVPISESTDMAGFARMLGFEVIVVARAGLGTINHSLLTLDAVASSGLVVRALVLSRRPEDESAMVESNVTEIEKRWSGRVLVWSPGQALLGRI